MIIIVEDNKLLLKELDPVLLQSIELGLLNHCNKKLHASLSDDEKKIFNFPIINIKYINYLNDLFFNGYKNATTTNLKEKNEKASEHFSEQIKDHHYKTLAGKKILKDYHDKLKKFEVLKEEEVEVIDNGTLIINFINQKSGRYFNLSNFDDIYICDALFPILTFNKKNFLLCCNGNFLVQKKVWNADCPNLLLTKFSAVSSILKTVNSSQRSWLKYTGTLPEWCQNYLLLK